jgi:hypothetical protein
VLLDQYDISEILAALDGIEAPVRSALTGPDGLITPEALPGLRQRAKLLHLDESRGELASYAVLEALSSVGALRNILEDARGRGLNIAID